MTDVNTKRALRLRWPIVRLRLEDEPDPLVAGTPAERIAMVWALTLDAWASMGATPPTYDRRQAPGRLIRKHG